jgi:hypothetical protein
MNPTGKKLISLFLVFSLMMLSVNLYAKERRGAELIITKKEGQQIKGELITGKENSLLLLDTEEKDVSVDIENIEAIKIAKKSKFLAAAAIGCAGAITGAMLLYLLWAIAGSLAAPLAAFGEGGWEDYRPDAVGDGAFYGALIGTSIGGIIGLSNKESKTVRIEGMTDWEIQETLDYLRKRARIRDYK